MLSTTIPVFFPSLLNKPRGIVGHFLWRVNQFFVRLLPDGVFRYAVRYSVGEFGWAVWTEDIDVADDNTIWLLVNGLGIGEAALSMDRETGLAFLSSETKSMQ